MRETIQAKLEEIQGLEVTTEMPDDILEKEQTYFSFTIQEDYQGSDLNNNYTYRPSIIGYVKRLEEATENTLDIVDKATKDILDKLKDLNIKASYNDVTLDNVRKIRITGYCLYNEINNLLV